MIDHNVVDKASVAQDFDTTADDSILSVAAAGKHSVEQLIVMRMPRLVEIYYVSGSELDVLSSAHSSIHLTFLGIVVGASVTLLVTLFTVPLNDRQHATVVALAAASVVATIYFAIRSGIDFKLQSRHIRKIKTSQSPPR